MNFQDSQFKTLFLYHTHLQLTAKDKKQYIYIALFHQHCSEELHSAV